MIYDYWKSHNLANEQLDEVYSDGDRGRDDAGSEVDLMLSNASGPAVEGKFLRPIDSFLLSELLTHFLRHFDGR
jgi:hypothetical protein